MARSQMEMGGKNPTIVLGDADLDLAATLVAKAGFVLTGQACTATSRAIVEKSVLPAFTEKLVAKARAVKVGNGLQAGVEMGPVVFIQADDGIRDDLVTGVQTCALPISCQSTARRAA